MVRGANSPQYETRSISGARTNKVCQIVEENLYSETLEKSDNIILAFGTNNLFNRKPYQIKNNLLYAGQLIQTRYFNATVYLATIPRRWDSEILDRNATHVNKLLRKSVHKYNLGLFDIATTFETQGKRKPKSEYWKRDGLHLSEKGLRAYQASVCNFTEKLENI